MKHSDEKHNEVQSTAMMREKIEINYMKLSLSINNKSNISKRTSTCAENFTAINA
jgi:hypothetical protein